MKSLFLSAVIFSLSMSASIARAGISNGSSPLLCGESQREVLSEKIIGVGDTLSPTEIRVQVFKVLKGCAGAYNVLTLKSGVFIEIAARNRELAQHQPRRVMLGTENTLRALVTLFLDKQKLSQHPLTISSDISSSKTPVRSEMEGEVRNIELFESATFQSTYTTKLGFFAADLDPSFNHLADYLEAVTIEIDGLPKIEFKMHGY